MSATGGVIDSFFVSLGFAPDTSGLKSFQRQAESAKESILSIGTALGAFATGFAVKEIAKIGSDFEQTRIQIAGFFTALGQSTDFNSALGDADEALQLISSAAAKLPGEAEEYQQVFTDTFSFVKGAVGGSIQEMTDFTNTLTAIGKAGRLDAGQIARETDELLSAGTGRAATRNRLWMQLLPLLRNIQGQAHLTSEEFNKMDEKKRAALLQQAFAGLKPMLDASANSFDAMWGAMISGFKKLTRLGTTKLFDGMKKSLASLNGMFFDADFNVTALGQQFVDTGQRVARVITNVVTAGAAMLGWLAKSEVAMKLLKAAAVLLGVGLAALAFEKTAGGVAKLFTGLMNLKRLLLGGLFLAIALVAEDLYVFYKGGDSVTGMLVNKFGPAAKYISEVVLVGLVAALVAVKREAISTGFALMRPFLPVIALGALAYWLGTRWKDFGEVTKAALVAVGTAASVLFLYLKRQAIQTAIGFFLMNLPLYLTIGVLALLAAAIYYVFTRWNEFGAGAKVAIVGATTVLGTLMAAFVAAKATMIRAALEMAASWIIGLGPIALTIIGLTALGVAIYEIAAHWDAVTDAIDRAIEKAAEFIGLGDDFLGRKKTRKELDAFDAKTGDGFQGGYQRDGKNDGESTDFLNKPGEKTGAPAKKKTGGFLELMSGLTGPGGFDPAAMLAAMPGLTGATGMPEIAGMTGAQAGAGARSTTTTVNNISNTTVPAVTVNVSGAGDPVAVGREVKRQIARDTERANRNVIRDATSKGPKL